MGFGWESEAINLKMATLLTFQDCYKEMIKDLCNWDNTFNGKDSKWTDSCSPSRTDGGQVTLKKWLIADESDTSMFGGTEIDGRGCWQFAQWTKWTPYVTQMGYDALKSLIIDPETHVEEDYNTFASSGRVADVEASL